MNRMIRRSTCAALAAVLILGLARGTRAAARPADASAAPGTVPTGINYQGRLVDNGFPVTATRNMTFRLYNAATGGSLLWASATQPVVVSQGIFGTTLSISTTALAGAAQKYLEVQVDNTTLQPREPLQAVPYAMIAKSVEDNLALTSLTAGSSVTASAFFGDGSHLSGVSGSLTGGTAGYVPRWSGATTLALSNFWETASSDTVMGAGGLGVVSSVTASAFFGDGSHLTGVLGTDSTKVLKAGDTMTGALNMANVNVNLTGAAGNVVGQSSMTASAFFGDGSHLTGVTAAGVAAPNVTAGTFGAGVLLPAANLTNGPVASAILPSTVAYTSVANVFTPVQIFPGGVVGSSAGFTNGVTAASGTFTATGNTQASLATSSGIVVAAGQVVAPAFSGAFYGSGAGLTGVTAAGVAAPNVGAGTFGAGVLLPAASLTNGPVASAILPSTVAYTSVANIFPPVQTFQGGVVGSSAGFTNGVTAASGTFTATGNAQFSLAASSGVSVAAGGVYAPFFSGTFYGSGAGLTGVTAAGVAAPNVGAGTFGAGVLLPAASLTNGPVASAILPSTVAYTSVANVFPPVQTFQGGVVGSSAGFTNGVTAASGTFTATGNTQASLATSSGIVVAAGGVYAPFFSGAFYGSGAGLTGVAGTDATKVSKAGDAMTGPLTLAGSTLTVQGGAFSVGGSTLVVSGGNVGIGTTSPGTIPGWSQPSASRTLEVSGDGSASANSEGVLALTNNRATSTTGDELGALIFAGKNNSGSHAAAVYANLKGAGGANGFGGSLAFMTKADNVANDQTRMMIDQNGNVGVGTTSPATKLDVNGGSIFRSSSTWAGVAAPSVSAAGTGALYFDSTSNQLKVSQNGGAWTPLAGGGSSAGGWSESAPIVSLSNPSDNVVVQSTMTVQGSAFSVGGSTFVVAGGNVGIGTASPNRNLVVAGTDGTYITSAKGSTVGELATWISGRQALVSVNSDNNALQHSLQFGIGGFTQMAIVGNATTANVGIGTTSPATKLHLSSGTLTVDGNAATGLQVFGSTFVVNSNGNVGIGTLSPGEKLNLVGGNYIGMRDQNGTFYARDNQEIGINGNLPAGNSGAHYLTNGYAGNMSFDNDNLGAWTWSTAASGTAGASATLIERMRIMNGGNVGIGTVSPVNEFVVSTGGAAGLEIDPTGFYTAGGIDVLAYDRTALAYKDIDFITNASNNSMVIKTSGNVGVGTTSPATKLHLSSGTLTIDGNAATSLTTTGNVGIGTNAPNRPLAIFSTRVNAYSTSTYAGIDDIWLANFTATNHNTGLAMATNANGGGGTVASVGVVSTGTAAGSALVFQTRSDAAVDGQRMVIDQNGHVGIGVLSPYYMLSIKGGFSDSSSDGSPSMIADAFWGAPGNVALRMWDNTATETVDIRSNGISDFLGGSVGIGTAGPATALQVVGDVRVGTSGTNGCVQNYAGTALVGTCSSDARLKTNVRAVTGALEKVDALRPVSYEWKVAEFPQRRFGKGVNYGLIAQEAEKVVPDLVQSDAQGYKEVTYGVELQMLALEAIKEQQAEIEALRAELKKLRDERSRP